MERPQTYARQAANVIRPLSIRELDMLRTFVRDSCPSRGLRSALLECGNAQAHMEHPLVALRPTHTLILIDSTADRDVLANRGAFACLELHTCEITNIILLACGGGHLAAGFLYIARTAMTQEQLQEQAEKRAEMLEKMPAWWTQPIDEVHYTDSEIRIHIGEYVAKANVTKPSTNVYPAVIETTSDIASLIVMRHDEMRQHGFFYSMGAQQVEYRKRELPPNYMPLSAQQMRIDDSNDEIQLLLEGELFVFKMGETTALTAQSFLIDDADAYSKLTNIGTGRRAELLWTLGVDIAGKTFCRLTHQQALVRERRTANEIRESAVWAQAFDKAIRAGRAGKAEREKRNERIYAANKKAQEKREAEWEARTRLAM